MKSVTDLIAELGVPHRAKHAFWALLAMGADATLPAVRAALKNPNADIRLHCCRLLDHFFVPDSLDDLLAMTDDADARVRMHAIHAMACDRCKADSCTPDEARTLPRAIAIVQSDPDPLVRAIAVEILGKSAHRDAQASAALQNAATSDPSPAVRKKATWFAPGGSIYNRTAPKAVRVKRQAAAAP